MGPPPPPPPKGGNQAPPPTPPRGTTPPPPIPPHNASGAVGGVGANPSNLPMFKRMSPVPSLPCRPGQGISQYPVMPPVTRGTSPTARPVIVPNSLEAQAQVDQMRMHALSLYPSTELNGAVVEPPPPYPMGTAAHSSAPPPPSYSQSLAMRQSPTHSSTSSDYRRSPGLPLHYPSVQFTHGAASLGPSTAASPIPACPSPVSSILSGSSRSSSMAMYRQGKTHSPIIMQSVKSTQVQKPVLQMAGAVANGPASPSELVGPVLPGAAGGVLPGAGGGVLPGGAYRGVATPVTVPPPPPSYAVSLQQLAGSNPPTPTPQAAGAAPSPVPTTCPPSYNASIQAKQEALHRGLSPAQALPPPPPYNSSSQPASRQQADGGDLLGADLRPHQDLASDQHGQGGAQQRQPGPVYGPTEDAGAEEILATPLRNEFKQSFRFSCFCSFGLSDDISA